ncbi:uncharacterized protein LOC108090518 [Drosophila ficusphila]|uniref:uncharacterized protein LOC108090518 n=1 Tax=Drosophila ficusphila TaxID=30025 RepID=UPI0007E5DEF8|nr:uncharacterized protein LOC108090518 [Drosophila ficusphila]
MRVSGATCEFSGHVSAHPQPPLEMEKLQPGDACLECQSLGKDHKLRFFYINLEEQLLKCESLSCLWPHNDEISSDEELEELKAAPPSDPLKILKSPSRLVHSPDVVPLAELDPDDDDEFILQLLQQLTPSTDADSVDSPSESNKNLHSMPNLLTEEPLEIKPCPELELPDLSFLEEHISEHKESPKAVIAEKELPLLPAKLRTSPKIKNPQSQSLTIKKEVGLLKIPPASISLRKPKLSSFKTPTKSICQGKQEIPLLPASLKSSPSVKPQGDPFSTPPRIASTQPQTPPAAVNIIISIPELNPAMPFLDAIKRHCTEAKPITRGRRPKRLAIESTGKGIRAQTVRHLIENLETTTDAKLSSPRS